MNEENRELASRGRREIEHGRRLAIHDPERTWGWGTPAGRVRAERRAALIVAGAHLTPAARVLEVGCGTGNFTERFARSGARILAVDISPDLLRQAGERGLPPDQVRFLEARFEDCAVHGPFDAVIGSSVLHHLDIEAAVSRIRSLLVPGGWMSFAEPNMFNPQVFLERKLRFLFPQVSPDETAFVRRKFAQLLRGAGFADVAIVPFDWLHPATPERLMRGVQWLGARLERTPGVREFAGSLHILARRPVEASGVVA